MRSFAPHALVLAPLALASVLAAPASAQESPTPSPTCFPPPDGEPGPCEYPPASSPTPTTTPHSDPACPAVEAVFPTSPVAVNEPVTITARVTDNGTPGTFTLRRYSPGEPVEVRRSDSATVTTYTVRLPETTGLAVSFSRPEVIDCIGGGPSYAQAVLAVRPALSIAATRTAVRSYSFTGRVLPGRGQAVALYRVDADGSRVLTSRTVSGSDGLYRIDRRFTGSGRFGFVATVGTTSTNVAGSSPVRPTLVH
ncbi:MAG: hypothetical protein JWN17_410 [Frankiales bacterium]|nr:hypothetical protein [Frankiales bacterium]